jgi:hypothetical protein
LALWRAGVVCRSAPALNEHLSSGTLRTVHLWLTWLWLAFCIPVLLTPLKNSVPLLVFISIYANVAGHFSAWQAARTETKQDGDA